MQNIHLLLWGIGSVVGAGILLLLNKQNIIEYMISRIFESLDEEETDEIEDDLQDLFDSWY